MVALVSSVTRRIATAAATTAAAATE